MKFKSLKPIKALKALLGKVTHLQRTIDAESSKRNPDWFRIITLKKQRLLVKDKIQRLKRGKHMVV